MSKGFTLGYPEQSPRGVELLDLSLRQDVYHAHVRVTSLWP